MPQIPAACAVGIPLIPPITGTVVGRVYDAFRGPEEAVDVTVLRQRPERATAPLEVAEAA